MILWMRATYLCCLAGVIVTLSAGGAAGQAGAPVQGKGAGPGDPANLGAYLTKDGKLTNAVEVRDEKTGFGTFAGMIYRVEPDGRWNITRIYRRQLFPESQGALKKDEIKDLARVLAREDALSLPSAGRPKVNPHVITVHFGPQSAVLTFGVDWKLTPTDPANPSPSVLARYSAIVAAVREAVGDRTNPAEPTSK